MIKEGYDHFEVTRQEPKVDFCEKKYVFDAVKPPDAKRDPVFEASAKCPAYVVPDEVAEAVREKQEADNAEFEKLVARGTPVARINTGIDGGMNRVFAAKLPGGNTGLSDGGSGLALLTLDKAPGTIPQHVNPPHGPVTSPDEPLVASMAPSEPVTRVASATPAAQTTQPQSGQSEGFFSSFARKIGLGGTADTTATTPPPAAAPARPKLADARPRPEKSSKGYSSKSETRQAAARPPLKPSESEPATDTPAPARSTQPGRRCAADRFGEFV